MEDSRILDVVRAVHETKMDWFWKRMQRDGEAEGLTLLIESRVLDNNEIASIEHSLQLLKREVTAEIAKTDHIARDGVAKEMAVSEAVRERERELASTWKINLVRGVVICCLTFLFCFGLFYSAFFVQQLMSIRILLVTFGVIFLITGVVWLEYIIQQKPQARNAHVIAINTVNLEVAEKLQRREDNIKLLKKIHQCLELIGSDP